MNTAQLGFSQGCPMNDWVPIPDWTKLNFTVFNIGNKLYARCNETHHTISSEPKTQILYKTIQKYWREHFKSKGYAIIECDVPKNESQKELYRINKMQRTLTIKKELIKTGVLRK